MQDPQTWKTIRQFVLCKLSRCLSETGYSKHNTWRHNTPYFASHTYMSEQTSNYPVRVCIIIKKVTYMEELTPI